MRLPITAMCVLVTAGCASTSVVVTKVTADNPAAEGLRYSLPKPFLLIQPNTNGDGGFTTEVLYLADESNTYAVQGKTNRGKYKLDMNVANGLLSKLQFARTDAAGSAEGIRVSGEVLKAELERRRTEEKARDDKSKTEQEAAKKELETLQKDVDAKDLDVALAEEEVKTAQAALKDQNGNTEANRAALRTAELKVAQQKLKLEASRKAFSDRAAAAPAGIFNEPTSGAGPAPAQPATTPRSKFWGPMLFAIVDDGKTASLKAVEWFTGEASSWQVPLETAAAPKTESPKPAAPALKDKSERSFTWPTAATTFQMPDLELTSAIKAVDTGQRQLFRKVPSGLEALPGPPFNVQLRTGGTSLVVMFTSRLAVGTYQILLPVRFGADGSTSITLDIDVR